MSNVEQAAADYYEADEEYESLKLFLPPDDPDVEEAKNRRDQAKWGYDQALEEQEAEENTCNEPLPWETGWGGNDEPEEEPLPWETGGSSSSNQSEFGDGVCEAPEEPEPWETESSSGPTSEFGDGACEAPEEPYPWEEGWEDGQSTVCDPYMQSCPEDEQLVCEGEDFFCAFVPCGPDATVVVPEVSSLVISVRTKTGKPISGAKVELRENLSATSLVERYTNAEGICSIQLIEEGSYEYLITKEGYGPTTGGKAGPVSGVVDLPPMSSQYVEVDLMTAGQVNIVAFDSEGNAGTQQAVLMGHYFALEAQLNADVDGQYFWQTSSDKIRLEDDTSSVVSVFGIALSESGVKEVIELSFRPTGEDAFPVVSYECMVIPGLLTVLMTDSTGASIGKGLVLPNDYISLRAETAVGVDGYFDWSTHSGNIRFSGGTQTSPQTLQGNTIDIEGISPSTSAGAEEVELTFTRIDGEKITEKIPLTVVQAAFSRSKKENKFGFDEMTAATAPPHVSVALDKTTGVTFTLSGDGLKVNEGVTCSVSDDIVWEIEDESVCTIEEIKKLSKTKYDVIVKATNDKKNAETNLNARLHRNKGPVVATVCVNRYQQLKFEATWGKFYDSRSPSTAISISAATNSTVRDKLNEIFRQICVTCDLSYCNGDEKAPPIDVPFEKGKKKDGTLVYLYGGTSEEQKVIEKHITGKTRVIVVANMESHFRLDKAAKKSDKEIYLKSNADFFKSNREYTLKGTNHSEPIYVVAPTSQTKKLKLDTAKMKKEKLPECLSHSYDTKAALLFPAAGWSGRVKPIYLAQSSTWQEMAETMAHELGHTWLDLHDLNDCTNVMNYDTGNTDTRLRFLKISKTYLDKTGTKEESQWEYPKR